MTSRSKMSVLTEPEFPPHLMCLKNVEALLRCPICFDYLNISMMTKCSHNFCSLCIRKFLSCKLQCPVCNLPMTELDLRNNRILDDLVMSFQEARQQLLQTNLYPPTVSPKALRPNAKRKASNASRPMVESTIMKHFLQKGNSPSSSFSSSSSSPSLAKRTRRQPPCNNKTLRPNPLEMIRAVKVELVQLPPQMARTLKGERVKRTVKQEKVEVPTEHTMSVKEEMVEVPAQQTRTVPEPVTRTVKEERVAVPKQVTRIVKKEMVEEPAMESSPGVTCSSESPSTSQSMKAVVKVECPVCLVGIPEHQINGHLDNCLIRDEKKESLRSSTKKRKPLAKLVYNLLTIQDLRKKLRDLSLPTQGSRDQLVRRHQEYVLMYNAECDSFSPKSAQDIAKEVEVNEKMRAQLQSKSKRVMVFSKNQTEEEIDKLHLNYRKQHSVEFSRLIDQVKGHWEASKKACVKEEVPEGAGEECPADELGDTAPCVLRVVSEDRAEDRDPPPPLSPTFSDVSVSSSISDVFSVEADRNTI
ncbi:E3 ubiquitin-protein ligase RAD18 [Conger conger]|uniref:E3 ubiquitin-protein ligase RAD18 n=1 Tax=Conger conger TaxID=82655 RepID=UPI002A5B0084|nr:E3 ubiquitin-protein ligase RAD18 [Conger conger]XP_061076528.1 E3 ubiquitin-protein ligase RAD18 [Conger conger]